MKSSLAFVAIISKNNKPIVLEDFRREKEISMHFITHSCLDIVDDKIKNIKRNSKYQENFLGYLGPALLPESDYSVFGWLGFTGVKILAVITENYDSRNEDKIRAVRFKQFLEEVQKLYQAVKNNPFYSKTDFTSQRFKNKLNETTYILN